MRCLPSDTSTMLRFVWVADRVCASSLPTRSPSRRWRPRRATAGSPSCACSFRVRGARGPAASARHPPVNVSRAGRICLFGEHSDWVPLRPHCVLHDGHHTRGLGPQAGTYRRFNSDIVPGQALVVRARWGSSHGLPTAASPVRNAARHSRYGYGAPQQADRHKVPISSARARCRTAHGFARRAAR